MPQPANQSAWIARKSSIPHFELGERLAEPGKAKDGDSPLPERMTEPQEKRSGGGYRLPVLENVQWEENKRGGFEAWHCPTGAVHRRDKTYLGYLGVRKLRQLEKESPKRFHELVTSWIAEKRRKKQIE